MTREPSRRAFAFFLHGHLPWVLAHGRWPHGAEWLCEAALGTYLPLLRTVRRLEARGVRGGITLGVSPVLAEQLAHPGFAELFAGYVDERIETVRAERRRWSSEGRADLAGLAAWWADAYDGARRLLLDELQGDLLGAFRALEDAGALEIATCGATHGYLPLLGRDESIALQIELARRVHERHFGRAPRGMWLPEAAYRPAGPWRSPVDGSERERCGLETFLSGTGLRYFLVDGALLGGGRSIGTYFELFEARPDLLRRAIECTPPRPAPARPRDHRRAYWVAGGEEATPGVRFFVRDPRTALQVWSGEHGYPGDPAYLEFHKKSEGGGHRYWRVTGPGVDLGDKEPWDPAAASARAAVHADHFRGLVAESMQGAPEGSILAAPFDAELFGHWWAEGPEWLERVLEGLAAEGEVAPTTFARHADDFAPDEIVRLPEGSWGQGGGHWVWHNPSVDWTWKLIHPAEDEVWDLWRRAVADDDAFVLRAAVAAGRQLALLVASDWQFLVTTGTAADYATDRVHRHADDLAALVDMANRRLDGREVRDDDRRLLDAVEARDDLFPEMGEAMRAAMVAGATAGSA